MVRAAGPDSLALRALRRGTAREVRRHDWDPVGGKCMDNMMLEDGSGRVWSVWEARPAGRMGRLPEPYAGGWLCFDSRGERRSLAPIPAHWRRAPVWRLRILLELASLRRAGLTLVR